MDSDPWFSDGLFNVTIATEAGPKLGDVLEVDFCTPKRVLVERFVRVRVLFDTFASWLFLSTSVTE